ncbi:YbaB/EbfC family nucleoid-associated protein [Cellulomonas gilvus]|uniref:YbaB/EbfC DNA-binding family protein n=1 Tax=Cellulomonas gilvus (strain ATCC 13127 / NRRL B-14078) TaxID=593907 RepID=F8A4A1_CELGA|nr:YbaB/EbfC family nucleoid-associated protein [Cellulomonas gilvus]AEI12007.1 hypothetical protein Celgi_1488 [Cellulomonas gilvus ATCC 13127]
MARSGYDGRQGAWVPGGARAPGAERSATASPAGGGSPWQDAAPSGVPADPATARASGAPVDELDEELDEQAVADVVGRSPGAARVREQVLAARRQAREARDLHRDVEAVRGTARSSGGEVTAEADPAGRLTRLTFAPHATALRPDRLAGLVEQTVRAAARDAGDRALRLVDERSGSDGFFARTMRAELERGRA